MIEYRFSLDVSQLGTQKILHGFRASEDRARGFKISLHNASEAFDLSEYDYFYLMATKPDGTTIYDECSVEDGYIKYTCDEQFTAVSGEVDCQIEIGKSNVVIYSPKFKAVVEKSMSEGSVVSEPVRTSLVNDINELKETKTNKTDFDELAGTVGTHGNQIDYHTSEIGKIKNIPIINSIEVSGKIVTVKCRLHDFLLTNFMCDIDLTQSMQTIFMGVNTSGNWFISSTEPEDLVCTFYFPAVVIEIENGEVVNYYPNDCRKLKDYVDTQTQATKNDYNNKINKVNNQISAINMNNVVIPIGIPENDKENKVLTLQNFVYNSVYYYISDNEYDYSVCELNTPYYVHVALEEVSEEWGNATILVSENATESGYYKYCAFKVFDTGVSYKFYCNNAWTLGLGDRFKSIDKSKAEQSQVDSIAEGLTNKTAYSLGVAGLYNEANELLKSWDKLIADGDITVVDNEITECAILPSKLIISNTVTGIGNQVFSNCVSLTGIVLSNNLTSIGDAAFGYCTSLKSITIPDSVTSIGGDAFSSCTSLESIIIPNGVTIINYSTFANCTSLNSINIPYSVTNISDSAFLSCTSLTDVYFKGTKTQWNSITISDNNEELTNATIHYELTNEVYNKIDSKADKTYVDTQDLALGERIDNLQENKAEQSQVDSIAEGLANKTALNTNDHNKFISDLNYTGSTAERIAFTKLNKRISTNGSTGTVVDLNGVADPEYNCTIIYCTADNDYVYVNALGGSTPRAWAFIDKDNKLISKSNVDVEYHGELKIPTNADRLIVNTKCKEFYCYEGRTLKNCIAANKTEITSIKSGYLSNDKYPVVKGTKQVNYDTPILINDMSPVSHIIKISLSHYSENIDFYVSGRNMLGDTQLPLGETINIEDDGNVWTSDFIWCQLPKGTLKLVVNGEALPDGLQGNMYFYDNSQNLLGATAINSDGTFYNEYASHVTSSGNVGTVYIKISLHPMINFTLNSVMITLPECSNEYIAQQRCEVVDFSWYGSSEIQDDDFHHYPDTIIVPFGTADNPFTVEYNRDVGVVLNELIGDVNTALDSTIQIQNNYIGSDN